MIPGGYYIKARKIQESDIALAPPNVRELWDWLIKEANHKDVKIGGIIIKRGQLIRTINDMRNGLRWKIGYRFQMYNEDSMKNAMRWLRKHHMVTCTKTPVGSVITVCNYDIYQNPKNYDYTDDYTSGDTNVTPMLHQQCSQRNKNVKNERNNIPPDLNEVKEYIREKKYNIDAEKWFDFYTSKGWLIGKTKMKDWKAAVRTWNKKDTSTELHPQKSRYKKQEDITVKQEYSLGELW